MGLERRGCVVQPWPLANWKREEPVDEAKPFKIPKREVWEAFKRVKANQGAAGVDGQSIAEFEANLSGNLYKLWNRLSSGSYFPPPVRRVEIPKANGSMRPLGIPTVADRVAQEVVRRYLEPILEPVFHADSYGYRPGKSALDAVHQARQRCWRYDWVLDLDIKGFFDSIDWELLLKAIRHHTDCPWVLLYIERWLKAPMQMEDGSVVPRMSGTPQGGVVSPTLANLFLHYAFDMWMVRTFPHLPFERYDPALQPDLMRPVRLGPGDEELFIEGDTACRIGVELRHPAFDAVRIELLIDGAIERVGEIDAPPVTTDLHHLWATVERAVLGGRMRGPGNDSPDAYLAGELGIERIGHVDCCRSPVPQHAT